MPLSFDQFKAVVADPVARDQLGIEISEAQVSTEPRVLAAYERYTASQSTRSTASGSIHGAFVCALIALILVCFTGIAGIPALVLAIISLVISYRYDGTRRGLMRATIIMGFIAMIGALIELAYVFINANA